MAESERPPAPSGTCDREWDSIVHVFCSDASDQWRRTLEPLIDACRASPLRRFFPFTSVNQLCFAETAWPFREIQAAYVEFSDAGDYEVRFGDGERWAVLERTRDPERAAAALVTALDL